MISIIFIDIIAITIITIVDCRYYFFGKNF